MYQPHNSWSKNYSICEGNRVILGVLADMMPEVLTGTMSAFNTSRMKHSFLDPQRKSNLCCYAKIKFRN